MAVADKVRAGVAVAVAVAVRSGRGARACWRRRRACVARTAARCGLAHEHHDDGHAGGRQGSQGQSLRRRPPGVGRSGCADGRVPRRLGVIVAERRPRCVGVKPLKPASSWHEELRRRLLTVLRLRRHCLREGLRDGRGRVPAVLTKVRRWLPCGLGQDGDDGLPPARKGPAQRLVGDRGEGRRPPQAGIGSARRACSGASRPASMIAPGGVIFVISAAVAKPRSATLIDPSAPTRMLEGFRSRCTTPRPWT